MMNLVYGIVDFGVSFMLYAIVGLIIGKMFYKQGLMMQKTGCWSLAIGLVIVNVHNNLGWMNLVELVKINPMLGLQMAIGITIIIPAIAMTMIKVVEKYNFRKQMKKIKWLI